MELFILHTLGLAWMSLGAARAFAARAADRPMVAALLGWGNLVLTSLLLSTMHRLGDAGWFLAVSGTVGVLTCLLLWPVNPEPTTPDPGPTADSAASAPWLRAGLALTLLFFGAAAAALAWTYAPNHPDSLTWHLPRALYYLGQDSLAHFAAADLRQTHLPFNYDLLLAFGLIYGPSLQWLNLFNLVAWVVGGIAVHRLCRQASLGPNAALLASWLALASGPVVAQAASTTVELPAGVALLCALVHAGEWRHSRRRRPAMLAGLAAGLAAGSDLRIALLGAGVGLLALVWCWRHRRDAGLAQSFRAWLVPVLLAGTFATPFALINFATEANWLGTYLDFALHRLPGENTPGLWASFRSFWHSPPPLISLNEDTVGLGFAGAWCLLGLAAGLARLRQVAGPAAWCTWLGLGWILLILCPPGYLNAGPRDFVPALLLLSPGVGVWLATGWKGLRSAGTWLTLAVVLAGTWSGGLYLLKNNRRPLIPLLNAAFAPPALPPLPLLIEHHLLGQSRIAVDTDGVNEPIFPLLALRPGQRATSGRAPVPADFTLLSRFTASRNSAILDLARRPAYSLVPVPAKRTAGVEFLATLGHEAGARDYFGLIPQAGRTPPIPSNRTLLVTLALESGTVGGPDARSRIRVAGLNPEDRARLSINQENHDGRIIPLAVFEQDGELLVGFDGPFRQLALRVFDLDSGQEIGATALPYRAQAAESTPPLDPSRPTNARSLFATDLVLANGPQAIGVEGLLPVEGPFPQWNLPLLRWQRQPSMRITVPTTDQLARLQVSFSFRLHVRTKAALEVIFNGRPVQQYRVDSQSAWLDQTLELIPQPGVNVLEFRDAPLNHEPDWLDYLARYPDVKKHVAEQRLPPEQGAREHYESHGRAEGRTVQTILEPEPAPDGYYFMYRNLRLEGFKSP